MKILRLPFHSHLFDTLLYLSIQDFQTVERHPFQHPLEIVSPPAGLFSTINHPNQMPALNWADLKFRTAPANSRKIKVLCEKVMPLKVKPAATTTALLHSICLSSAVVRLLQSLWTQFLPQLYLPHPCHQHSIC